ncbi:MAG: histidinol-phosphate transaminase [Clostridium sp.]|uniref:pyridoxal phosphate-dependent aminotransferase n=1 Tax=Clostridium sp. TaxID=1506 RepID=UPI00302CC18C
MKHGGDIYSQGTLIGKTLLDFSSNVNPTPISEDFKLNISEALEILPLYPDIKYRTLKNNIIMYLKKSEEYFTLGSSISNSTYINNLSTNNVIVGNGAAEVLDLAINSINSITIVVPSFVEYEDFSNKYNLKINFSHLNEFMEYNYDDIYEKIQVSDGLILGNPNNPNGCIIDHKAFNKILDYCECNNKLIIIDEAFIEFVLNNNQSMIKYVNNYSCLVIVRAITKFFSMAGVRFGYAITKNSSLLEFVNKNQNPWSVNCFAEIAVKYAMFDTSFIRTSIQWLKSEHEFLYEGLNDINFIDTVFLSHGNYYLCKLKGINSDQLSELLMSTGILIRNCSNYTGLDNNFVRIAIKDRMKNEILIKALKNISTIIKTNN